MKNNKGFTLMELLGVIVILLIVTLIAIALFKTVNDKAMEKNYDNLISYIENAAVQFATDNSIEGVITLQDLIEAGYVTPDDGNYIYNPINKANLTCNKIVLSYNKELDRYTSKFTDDIQDEDENNKCNADFVQVYEINSITSNQNLGVIGNVVLLLDISGSMADPISSNNDMIRLSATKEVINSLASKILSKSSEYVNTSKIALITFSDNAEIAHAPTSNYNSFKTTVDRLEGFGGTNWEAALQEVKKINFEDDNEVYVIFISDGNPTFRLTKEPVIPDYLTPLKTFRYGTVISTDKILDSKLFNSNNAYGSGYEQPDNDGNTEHAEANVARCYYHAVDDAQQIVNAGYEFYTIFAYGDEKGSQNMKNLTISSGVSEDHYYNASNSEELYYALITIFQEEIAREGTATTYLTQDGAISLGTLIISADKPLHIYNGTELYKTYDNADNKYLKIDNDDYYFFIKRFAEDNKLSVKDITIKYYN